MILLSPALVVLAVVTVLPFVFLLSTSFTPLNLARPATWWDFSRPLGNFSDLLADGRFLNSLGVQLRLSVFTVGFQLFLGLGAAGLLNSRFRFLEAIRALFIIPMVLPPIVVAIMWKVLFTPDISILNWVLGLLGLPQPAWLAEPGLALPAIIIADVWEWFPFTMLMLLAALQMMPSEPVEAARIDGASAWQVFLHIVLPLLRPAIVVTVLFRLIESVKAFPLIFVMTGGGPGTVTEATNYYAFLQGFNYSMIGYSAAISVVVLASTLLASTFIISTVGTHVEVE
ncbi:MAG TPA: sugar ABC transporter permease [Candidatus Acidoferrum sp.]|nr:sugar ABC transporter permease [Candidatus Methylomirabilis sp.]HWU40957.1 sugar ABC transporter permease [Candidatus Acidoferrum sp.]